MTNGLSALSRFGMDVLLTLSRDRFADGVQGGCHERLDAALMPVATGRKRLMVQARQLYLLSHAALLGDRSGERTAERGYEFLRDCFLDRRQGGWYFAVTPEGDVLAPSKDLYGHAFVLFALAWLHRAFAVPDALELAAGTMDILHARTALPVGGHQATASRDWTHASDSLSQNPHMHLLEAMLALHEASGDPRWLTEADALVRLFRDRLFHRGTGTLREFFSPDWSPHPDRGDIVEPGHHFEWVWLLDWYRRRGGTLPVIEEAETLFCFAMRNGFDAEHGGIHDQVAPDGTPLLRTRRIWPVAEAVKACVAVTRSGRDFRCEAESLAAQLFRMFVPPDRTGWHETLTREGVPTMMELPGSTPYHLFLAAAEAGYLVAGGSPVAAPVC